MTNFGFDKAESAVLRHLRTPERIQRFLDDDIAYNKEKDGETCRGPRRVLRDRMGHCAEGAYFAAAALRVHGHQPLIVDLMAVRDDDHLLAVFQVGSGWGAIAKSNYSGLRFREPVYRSIRELVMSYYAHYYNLKGELTLREFSRPVNLRRFDRIHWMTTEEDLYEIGDYLCTVRHWPVMSATAARQRRWLDRRLLEAGLVGAAD